MINAFFSYARERHSIYLRRQAGLPRADWTQDKILQEYRFCNIFRELDTTTIWLREHVRDPLRSKPEVLLAVVLFRWFNRIKTGEAIFQQTDLIGCVNGCTAWESALNFEHTADLKRAILSYCGKGPYVTGSYIIKTRDGMDKLSGVLWCIKNFMTASVPFHTGTTQGNNNWLQAAKQLLEWKDERPHTLEHVWKWLLKFPYLGDFMAYEIVTDLRYTDLLCNAPDIMTWANPGPGAMRGLNRIHGRDLDKKLPKTHYIKEMQDLLVFSQLPTMWPQYTHDEISTGSYTLDKSSLGLGLFPMWDMRTVEHTLCEFDKYQRVLLGQGAPRQKFK